MVKTAAITGSGKNADEALLRFDDQLTALENPPQFAFVFYGCSLDDAGIHHIIGKRWPETTLIGGTSSRGVMSREGMGGEASVGAFLVWDETGDYGSAALPFGEDPKAAAKEALEIAL